MPRSPRTTKEVNSVKGKILDQALQLINADGFEGFSMRKLANQIGVQAVTIYNYYENKDDLYIAVLTKGFKELYEICLKAYKAKKAPAERLEAMIRAYLEFGLKKVNFYNLMFTWHVPKYQDYVGTPMEKAAYHELVVAQKVILLFIRAVKELAAPEVSLTDKSARFYIVYFWSLIHGYIAGNNNHLLSYIYSSPEKLKDRLLNLLFKNIHIALEEAIKENEQAKQ
jgi:AcrR family transcriptional regulator